jgi:predicted outer membrane repeat protein
MTIRNTTIHDHTGAVAVANNGSLTQAVMTISNSSITNSHNLTAQTGGALLNVNGQMTIDHSTISNNSAECGQGGAILSISGSSLEPTFS